MHPLSIVLALGFLGELVVVGAVLVGFGARRLQRQVHAGNTTVTRTGFVCLDVLLVALGLVLAFYGIMGTYRVVWGD